MLPKSQRLNLKTDFKWVAAGKKIETKYLKLFIRFGENVSPRVGIAMSSKLFNKASQRNRARRLVSQAFQSSINYLPLTINIIALPKAHIIEVKSKEVLSDLMKGLSIDEKTVN